MTEIKTHYLDFVIYTVEEKIYIYNDYDFILTS